MTSIQRRSGRGWKSALLGLTLVGVLSGCGSFRIGPAPSAAAPSEPASSGTAAATATPKPRYQATTDLAVGDCFDPITDADDETMLAAIMRRCDEPHLMETFGVPILPSGDSAPFPGSTNVQRDSEALCRTEFARYVGVEFDDSQLRAGFNGPDEVTWSGGDRGVLCFVEADEGAPFTKSIKGSRI
jgi:putative regulator of septum formation